jgi:hypothetical protein
MWGGTDHEPSVETIRHAVELGITFIDRVAVFQDRDHI